MTVRPARRQDLPRLVALLAGGTIRGAEDPGGLAHYEAAFDEIAASPHGEVLVAEAGAAVVGMCQLILFRHLQERGGLCAEIESVHVEAGRR
ncbi:MAG: GNAT family N-acetyltransferase, partial [Acidimicrobiales bacterium]